jgi:hypothetical protein
MAKAYIPLNPAARDATSSRSHDERQLWQTTSDNLESHEAKLTSQQAALTAQQAALTAAQTTATSQAKLITALQLALRGLQNRVTKLGG